jgi:hypothetical protein
MREVIFLGHWDRGWPETDGQAEGSGSYNEWGVPVTELRSFLGLVN